jgi:hypothetical protein
VCNNKAFKIRSREGYKKHKKQKRGENKKMVKGKCICNTCGCSINSKSAAKAKYKDALKNTCVDCYKKSLIKIVEAEANNINPS